MSSEPESARLVFFEMNKAYVYMYVTDGGRKKEDKHFFLALNDFYT